MRTRRTLAGKPTARHFAVIALVTRSAQPALCETPDRSVTQASTGVPGSTRQHGRVLREETGIAAAVPGAALRKID
jgi:hypothetical protein